MGGTFRIQNSTSFIYNKTYGFGDPRLKKPPYIDQNHENVNVDRDYSDLQCVFLARVCVCAKRVKDNSHVSLDCAWKMGSPGLFAKGVNNVYQ